MEAGTASMRCSCGVNYSTRTLYLLRKSGQGRKCSACFAMKRRTFQLGDKSGQLTIIGVDQPKNGQTGDYICRCSCGTEIRKRGVLLARAKNASCGCAKNGKWQGVGAVGKEYFTRTKASAEKRGILHTITHEYIAQLLEMQNHACALSGVPIGFPRRVRHQGKKQTHTASLDRIDNRRGYVPGNVWWVHKDLNRMKNNHDLVAFLGLCKRVTAHAGEMEQLRHRLVTRSGGCPGPTSRL